MEPRVVFYVLLGIGLWAGIALERPLRRIPVALPLVFVVFGWAVFQLPFGLPSLNPATVESHAVWAEHFTEVLLIISLMAAGVAIDRPFSWGGWRQVWPLLVITMPLSILAVALLGWWGVGLSAASAALLGAAVSPTDPVLARNVQVGPPGHSERDDVRFDLTVEAGLNDGLAFPFTYLAIALASAAPLGEALTRWVLYDFLYRTVAGIGVGIAVGWLGSWYAFRHFRAVAEDQRETEEKQEPPNSGGGPEQPVVEEAGAEEEGAEDEEEGAGGPKSGGVEAEEWPDYGVIVTATLLAAYGIAELVHGYGFIAVFVGAVSARQRELRSDHHRSTHHFVDQLEKMVTVAMLLGFGGMLASGVLSHLTWPGAFVGAAIVFVIRPITGIVAQLRSELPWAGRWAVAFLGVRGMGTVYYLAYARHHGEFSEMSPLWAIASFAILLSIVVHGMTEGPILRWLERHRANKPHGASSELPDGDAPASQSG